MFRKCCEMFSTPGRNIARSHLFVRPEVLNDDHYGNIPGSHHTQSTTREKTNNSNNQCVNLKKIITTTTRNQFSG